MMRCNAGQRRQRKIFGSYGHRINTRVDEPLRGQFDLGDFSSFSDSIQSSRRAISGPNQAEGP